MCRGNADLCQFIQALFAPSACKLSFNSAIHGRYHDCLDNRRMSSDASTSSQHLTKHPRFSSRTLGIIAAVVTILIWTSFIVIARASVKGNLLPLDMVFLRFIGAGVVLLPWVVDRTLPATRKEGACSACCHAVMARLVTLRIQNVGFGWRCGWCRLRHVGL